jgi:antitoxin (DNA-binding transcriptional repressor) of toxin-antitoxin stability system
MILSSGLLIRTWRQCVDESAQQVRVLPNDEKGTSCVSRYHGYNSHMERATIAKLKDNLSAYLRKVRAGVTVVIYDRDVPIACIERIESSQRGTDRLALLHAQGVTRPATRALSAKQLRAISRKLPGSARLSEALRDERGEGR